MSTYCSLPILYCINGWDEHWDDDANRTYTCPRCGAPEGKCEEDCDWVESSNDTVPIGKTRSKDASTTQVGVRSND